MALIRVIPRDNVHRKWLREKSLPITPAELCELMKDSFPYDQKSISVFNVTTDVEETRAVVAHYLTLISAPNRLSFQIVWALRIKPEDLDGLGIEINDAERGKTGVRIVDFSHQNLIGDRDAFDHLVHRILDAIRQGEDRLRVVGQHR